MRKLAIFVEGQTEHLFVEKLVREIAGSHRVHIESVRCEGGRRTPRLYTAITARAPAGSQFYVLIFDCRGDGNLLSVIRDRYSWLSAQGYALVLGLRDVYPVSKADFPALKATMETYLPTGPVPAHLVFACREIEAWFIAEESHFATFHPALSAHIAQQAAGVSIAPQDVEEIDHPAEVLDQIYRAVNMRYRKDRRRVQRVVNALDFDRLYIHVAPLVGGLNQLCGYLDGFLSS